MSVRHLPLPLVSMALATGLVTACGTTVPQADQRAAQLGNATSGIGQAPSNTGDTTGRVDAPAPGGLSGSATTQPSQTVTNNASGSTGPAVPTSGPTLGYAGPVKGRGFDAHNAYIGFTVATDVSTVGGALGVSAVNFGDQEAMARAVVADVNTHGGVLGRKLNIVFDDQDSSQSDSAIAQQACTSFTQDNPVFGAAALLPATNTDNFYACMKQHDTPMLNHSQRPITDELLAKYGSDLSYIDNVSYDRFATPWIARLKALGYFTGWDTSKGAPGSAPVKVGIIYQSDLETARAYALVIKALKAQGIAVADPVTYSGLQDQQSVQGGLLKLHNEGVTHLMTDVEGALLVPTSAEQQQYRPRYGLSTQDFIASFMEANAPARQLNGALGSGWVPTSDVSDNQDPHATTGTAACRRVMARARVDITPRQAQLFAYATCDSIGLLVAAATQAGGFSSNDIRTGIAAAAPAYHYAMMFAATRVAGRVDHAGTMRDVGFNKACSCFRYLSSTNHTF